MLSSVVLAAGLDARPSTFEFGTTATGAGFTAVTPDDILTSAKGYGFDLGFPVKAKPLLAAMLVDDIKAFDPSKPDSASGFNDAVWPLKDLTKPHG